MSDIPYLESNEKIKGFFEALKSSETPTRFTYRYLIKIGFPSSKDRGLVGLLKQLGFIDRGGRPTQDYHSLKDLRQYEGTLRRGIERAYASLLDLDSRVLDVSEDVLNGYFGRLTGESLARALIYTRTFKALAGLAGWGGQKETASQIEIKEKPQLERGTPARINLSINLPTTTDEKVYQTLFKHLKDLVTP